MLLRASGEMGGGEVDVKVVTDPERAAASGVAHAEALVQLAGCMVGRDDAALTAARGRVLEEMGSEALVDAVAIASNFERMVRIADSTGIPLDAILGVMTEDVREELALGEFGSAANTPATGAAGRSLGRLLRPTLRAGLRLAARLGAGR